MDITEATMITEISVTILLIIIGAVAVFKFRSRSIVAPDDSSASEEQRIAEQELKRLEVALKDLEKRLKNRTPKQVEDYWKNDK